MRSLWYQNTYCGGDGLWNKTSNGTLGGSRTTYVQVYTTSGDRRDYTLVSHVQFGTKLCVSDRNSKHASSTNGCSPLYTTPCPLVLSAAVRRFSSTSPSKNFSSVSGRKSEFRTVGGPTHGEGNEEKHILSVFVSSALHVCGRGEKGSRTTQLIRKKMFNLICIIIIIIIIIRCFKKK